MGTEIFSGVFAPGSADLGDMRERFVAAPGRVASSPSAV